MASQWFCREMRAMPYRGSEPIRDNLQRRRDYSISTWFPTRHKLDSTLADPEVWAVNAPNYRRAPGCRSRYVRPIGLRDEEQTVASVKVSGELYRSTVRSPGCAYNQQGWHVGTSAERRGGFGCGHGRVAHGRAGQEPCNGKRAFRTLIFRGRARGGVRPVARPAPTSARDTITFPHLLLEVHLLPVAGGHVEPRQLVILSVYQTTKQPELRFCALLTDGGAERLELARS
jgi:hypothetical protein